MNYRDHPHRRPESGAELPAFIVSEYSEGDLLIYSHGSFDIWCVYHAIKIDDDTVVKDTDEVGYPLITDTVKVKDMTGCATDFQGSFYEYAYIDFDFDAPEDVEYLQELRELAEEYGKDDVWNSFMELYECIPQKRGVSIDRKMTAKSAQVASRYPNEERMRLLFDCLLCTMIAENNRLKCYGSSYDTRLGKKIKALGVYQAIYETSMTIAEVANFSRKKGWREIDAECAKRGITTPNLW